MRLTKTDRYGHFYTNKANCRNVFSLDGKKLEGEFFENQTLAIDGNAIDKLGQLEDIEDELGIELVILFNALRNGVYYRMSSGQITKDYVYLITNLMSIGQVNKLDYSFMTCFEKHTLLFTDYGKTWALTKEELEK